MAQIYIHHTREYYAQTAKQNLDLGMSPLKYVDWMLSKLVDEKQRAQACLSEAVAEEVENRVRKEAGFNVSERVIRPGECIACRIRPARMSLTPVLMRSYRRGNGQQRRRCAISRIPIRRLFGPRSRIQAVFSGPTIAH